MPCASCHDAATNWSTNTPPAAPAHINGTFTVAGGVTFTYGGFTYPTTKGSCATNICHNNGANGTNYNAGLASYSWGTAIGAVNTCNECHRDTAAPLNTGGHQRHIQTTTRAVGGAIVCGSCHAAATVATHANGSVNLVAPATGYTADLIVVGGVTSNGTCGNNTCHNNGQNGNPDQAVYSWGTAYGAGDSCVECHGDTAALMLTQAHANHLNGSVLFGQNITCTSCHGTTPQTANTHANGTVNFLAGGVTFTYGVAADAVVQTNGGTFGSCGTNAVTTAATTVAIRRRW
jgi:predicted CxxxxCH...CXXCH cytochrome family protein